MQCCSLGLNICTCIFVNHYKLQITNKSTSLMYILGIYNDISISHGELQYKAWKNQILMEETLDIALDFRCSNISFQLFKIHI